MSKIDPVELNNLLNAYLDDELTDARKQKVEDLLKEDAEAQTLLAGLKQVRQMLAELPRVKAPADLAESIIHDLEREVLLHGKDKLDEEAGQKHLRRRRLLETAAMAVLTGAIVMIVYNVLNDNWGFKSRPNATEPVMVWNQPPDETKLDIRPEQPKVDEMAALTKPQRTLESIAEKETSTLADQDKASSPPAAPQYSAIKLVVSYEQANPGLLIQNSIYENQINQVISNLQNPDSPQFAFVCRPEQFDALFQQLQQLDQATLQLVLPDDNQDREIILAEPSRQEALALAGEANRQVQNARALQWKDSGRVSVIANRFDTNDMWAWMPAKTGANAADTRNDLAGDTLAMGGMPAFYGGMGGGMGGMPVTNGPRGGMGASNLETPREKLALQEDISTAGNAGVDYKILADANHYALRAAPAAPAPTPPAALSANVLEKIDIAKTKLGILSYATPVMDLFQIEAESQKASLVAVEIIVQKLQPEPAPARTAGTPATITPTPAQKVESPPPAAPATGIITAPADANSAPAH